jgi:type IV secretory pathway VirB10-like protein
MFGLFSRRDRVSHVDQSMGADDYESSPRAPERPPVPRPEGLNRNALTIAAVIMGTLVLAAVVFMQPARPITTSVSGQQVTPSLDQGTFLDQPPSQPVAPTSQSALVEPGAGRDSLGVLVPPSGASLGARSAGSIVDSPYIVPVEPMRDEIRDARIEAFRAALVAPVRTVADESDDATPTVHSVSANEAEAAGVRSTPSSSSSLTTSETSPRSHVSLDEPRAAMQVSVDSAPLPYAVQAGTLVSALLITEINSDLPGQVLAQIARDVYDTRSQRTLLIPSGAKLIGTYEDQVPVGRDRLLVAWTRIILPDGRSISLPGLQTKDRTGAGGVSDRVDRHTRRTFGTTALLSLIGAGLQLSQPRGAITANGYYPSAGEVAAAAVGQQLAEVAQQLLRRDLDARPTIHIRQGLQFNVFLNTDLVFQEPYVARQ